MHDHADCVFDHDRSPIGMIDWNVHLDRRYNRCYNQCYNRLIVPPFHIKPEHSSVSYQLAIYQKYDRRGRQLPSGYVPLVNESSVVGY